MIAVALDLERWRRDGYLLIDRVLTGNALAEFQTWVDEIESWVPGGGPWLQHDEMTDSGPQRARSENFMPFHEGMRRLLTEGLLVDMAGQLLGEPAALFKEKINYKHPGGGGYAPHQDMAAYPQISRCITCLVAADDAGPENGCLEFAPGYQWKMLPRGADGCVTEELARDLPWVKVPTAPGSLLWFDGLAPHRSGPNRTDRPRRALYLTYSALSEGELRTRYYAEKGSAFAVEDSTASAGPARISLIGHFQGRAVPPKGEAR
jgi:hypothetical protein